MNQKSLESVTFILRPNYDRINNLDVVNPGIPWGVISPIEDHQHELGRQFMGRVGRVMTGCCDKHRGPKDKSWKMIGDRKTVPTNNYDFGHKPRMMKLKTGNWPP